MQRAGTSGRTRLRTIALLTAFGLGLPAICLGVAACASLGGGKVETRVVLWFDKYDEVFTGSAVRQGSVLSGGVLDMTNQQGDIRCVGRSAARIVPPDATPPTRCDGIHGSAMLTCSDGRDIAFDYSVEEACASGYGVGRDHEGHAVHCVFGGSREHAALIAQEARQHLAGAARLPATATLAGSAAANPATNTGTAFFVTWEGHLVTNYHVIQGHGEIQVQLGDGDMVDAEVVETDERNDLAVLRVDAIRRPLTLHSGVGLVKGEEVFALGYPLVAIQGQEQKATFGRINALSGLKGDARFTQVDVPIQPGNSGGPLINRSGQVVGVITSMLDQQGVLAAAGVIPQNVNYALKPRYVRELLSRGAASEPVPPEASSARLSFSELVAETQSSVVLVVAW